MSQPPYRSRRAVFPHRAPASGQTRRHRAPAVPSRAPVAGFPGPVSGPCGTRPGSPWPAPFSPPPPPALAHQDHCSGASPILWGCPTPCTCTSRSYPLGSPCGPGHPAPGQMQGLPGSAPRVSVHARGLRPRQVCPPLALAGWAVSPSACSERVGTQDWPISGLNTLPAPSPVNASHLPLPRATHDSGPVWLAGPSLSGTSTLQHIAGLSRRTLTLYSTAGGGQAPSRRRCDNLGPSSTRTRHVVLLPAVNHYISTVFSCIEQSSASAVYARPNRTVKHVFQAAFPAADHGTARTKQRVTAVKSVSPGQIDDHAPCLAVPRCLCWSQTVQQGRSVVLDGVGPSSAAVGPFFSAPGG